MYLSPHADLGVSEGIKTKDGVVNAAPAQRAEEVRIPQEWVGGRVKYRSKGRRLEAHMFADSSGENEEYS